MKNYRITVNGTSYDVTVEELAGGAAAPESRLSRPRPGAASQSDGR